MQLRSARLCLDCEEIHDAQQCPSCASETFAYITRWVPVPDRPQTPDRLQAAEGPAKRSPPLPAHSMETLGAYREMLRPEEQNSSTWRTLKRGAVGLALFGLAGWVWRTTRPDGEVGDSPDRDSTERKP